MPDISLLTNAVAEIRLAVVAVQASKPWTAGIHGSNAANDACTFGADYFDENNPNPVLKAASPADLTEVAQVVTGCANNSPEVTVETLLKRAEAEQTKVAGPGVSSVKISPLAFLFIKAALAQLARWIEEQLA